MSVQFTVWNSSDSRITLLLPADPRSISVRVGLEDGGRTRHSCSSCCVPLGRKASCMRSSRSDFGRGTRCSSEGRQSTVGQRLRLVGSWVLVLLVPRWLTMPGGTGTAREFPNTYYAKLGTGRSFKPFSRTRKGRKYINAWRALTVRPSCCPWLRSG